MIPSQLLDYYISNPYLYWINYLEIIVQDEDLSWENKYNLIFSKYCSKKIYDQYPDFDWVDLDTSYEEDVRNFVYGFKKYCEQLNN